jgi:hypothetical protein
MGVTVESIQDSSVTSGTSLWRKKNAFLRIKAGSQKIHSHTECVVQKKGRVVDGGLGVVVSNKVVCFAFVLKFYRWLHHAKVISQVKLPRWLNTG